MAEAVAAVCTPEVCNVTSHRDIMARDVSSRSGLRTTQAAQKKSPNFTHRTEAASPMRKVWDFLWSPHFVRCVLPLVCLVVAISLSLSRFFSWSPFKSRPSFNQVLACSTFVIRACAQHVHDMAASIRTCAKLARPLHGRPRRRHMLPLLRRIRRYNAKRSTDCCYCAARRGHPPPPPSL